MKGEGEMKDDRRGRQRASEGDGHRGRERERETGGMRDICCDVEERSAEERERDVCERERERETVCVKRERDDRTMKKKRRRRRREEGGGGEEVSVLALSGAIDGTSFTLH